METPILLDKLGSFGIQGIEHSWFDSYLSNRTQFVSCNDRNSDLKILSVGVPQGTILGPILFLIYANDLAPQLPNGCITMYADDITLYCPGRTLTEAQNKLQLCVDNTVHWLNCNMLIVNPSKSCTMTIGSRAMTRGTKLKITINGSTLTETDCFKLLGIELDQNITWKNQISATAKKISSKIGLIRRLQNYLPTRTIQLLYAPLIQSHIDYCLSVWGACSKSQLAQIQKLQNRAARVFTKNFKRTISSRDLCESLGWMSVSERFRFHTCSLIYRCLYDKHIINNMTDTFISDLTFVRNKHNYGTRNSYNKHLNIPKPRTEQYKHSLLYNGPILWNSIPLFIRNSDNLDFFKAKLKSYISR